jgi:hypothetical protein
MGGDVRPLDSTSQQMRGLIRDSSCFSKVLIFSNAVIRDYCIRPGFMIYAVISDRCSISNTGTSYHT